ncbi:VOC family protein [Flavihumibacter sp. R14]|nr:VOC family protein [Flavihumibacter soli]
MKKVVHFEIPANDLERAKKFYSIFEWQLQDWPMPDGSTYVGARTVETDETTYQPKEPGAINGGIVLRDKYSSTPSVTINVPSIDEYQEKVKTAGGSIVKSKELIEGMGYYAYVNDTEGNLLGLWEDVKK